VSVILHTAGLSTAVHPATGIEPGELY